MPLSTSVVLCTYNGARFLAALWESLLRQSRLPDEIVVRDDASTDATLDLLENLGRAAAERGIRVRISRNPHNIGYVANFEAALQDAAGDVLLLCDQDDAWHPGKLDTQLTEFSRRPSLQLLCGNARRVDEAGRHLRLSLFDVLRVTAGETKRIHEGKGFEVLLRRSLATGATIALRRSLLDDALPVGAGWVHDEWLAIVAAALGGFDCLESALIDYRQHDANQIGMPERGLAEKWADLLKPRAAMIDALIRREEALLDRLRTLAGKVSSAHCALVAEKLAHLRTRQAMRGMPWSRFVPVLREAASGRYRRYASGWRSALRDLARRG